MTDLWTATVAAFPTVRSVDFSSSYLETMNNLIDLDAARKAARDIRVPPDIFFVLFVYLVVTAGVLGYVLVGGRGRAAAGFLFVLLAMSVLLVIDIDRAKQGGITESQAPMLRLRDSLRAQPQRSSTDRIQRPLPYRPARYRLHESLHKSLDARMA